jgi:hypothetical protein
MQGILAENVGGPLLVGCGEIIILLLALFAVYYAIQDERGRALTFIAPAVIWIVSWTLYIGCVTVKEILKGNIFISENGIAEFILNMVGAWIPVVILPFVISLIVFLILRFKSRG